MKRMLRLAGGIGVLFFGFGAFGLAAAPAGRYGALPWVVQLLLLLASALLLKNGTLPMFHHKAPQNIWPEEPLAEPCTAPQAICPNCGAPGQLAGTSCEYCGAHLP